MFSPQITELLENLKKGREARRIVAADESLIQVNRLTSKAGAFYEKVRYLVDYKEEHTIRRAAIERILKRKILFEKDTADVGRTLLQELLTGGYLANNSVSEGNAAELQRLLSKYLALAHELVRTKSDGQYERKTIVNLAASEIELFLYPTVADEFVVDAFYKTVVDRIKSNYLSAEELSTQTYLACRRGLLNNDDDKLLYHLFIIYVPQWRAAELALHEVVEIASILHSVLRKIQRELNHPVRWQLVARVKNYSIYYSVIRELIERFGVESERIFADKAYLDVQVKEIMDKKSERENVRTRQSGMRAVFYILVTKIILAVVFELPYELKFLHRIDYLPLGTNIVFHPLLLFIMAQSVPLLGDKNTQAVIQGVHSVLYGGEVKTVMLKSERSGVFGGIFVVLYVILFAVTFSILLSVLDALEFNPVSMLLFLFFLTLVSYFGLRIRYNAKRFMVEQGDESTLSLLWNIFTLPIVRAGRYLSTKFAAVNIFVFILDFIIETPFKLILKFSDAFLFYLKEKREDTV